MNNLLKHQKGDIERNKKKIKKIRVNIANILKNGLAKLGKKNIIALLALRSVSANNELD